MPTVRPEAPKARTAEETELLLARTQRESQDTQPERISDIMLPPETTRCEHCGNPIHTFQKFCGRCGKEVAPVAAPWNVVTPEQQQQIDELGAFFQESISTGTLRNPSAAG